MSSQFHTGGAFFEAQRLIKMSLSEYEVDANKCSDEALALTHAIVTTNLMVLDMLEKLYAAGHSQRKK